MGKRAFPPLPTRPQLVAVQPALFFFRKGSNGVKIVAGEHNLRYTDGSEQKISVVRHFTHPQYGAGQKNDICLLKLGQDLRFDSYTQPACLPKLGN